MPWPEAATETHPGSEFIPKSLKIETLARGDGSAGHTDEGVCFKYFKAGKAGFHPDGGWTLFTKG